MFRLTSSQKVSSTNKWWGGINYRRRQGTDVKGDVVGFPASRLYTTTCEGLTLHFNTSQLIQRNGLVEIVMNCYSYVCT